MKIRSWSTCFKSKGTEISNFQKEGSLQFFCKERESDYAIRKNRNLSPF